MIQFDEEEHLECATDDVTFRFIERLYGRTISERLLYPKPRDVPVGENNGATQKEGVMGIASDSWSDTA